jgi:hypothetical protein
MDVAIMWHKFGPGGAGSIFDHESWAAFDFAAEGYTGQNPHHEQDGPGCDTTNVQPYANNLGWHWDTFYEPSN